MENVRRTVLSFFGCQEAVPSTQGPKRALCGAFQTTRPCLSLSGLDLLSSMNYKLQKKDLPFLTRVFANHLSSPVEYSKLKLLKNQKGI